MKIHSKIKPFECKICGGKYSRSSTLKIHSYTHLQEKPFKCPFQGCNRGFTEKGNMQVHLKTHYKESKHNTPCEATSTQLLMNKDDNNVHDNMTIKNSNDNSGIWNNNCNVNIYNTNVINFYKCIYPFPYQTQTNTYTNNFNYYNNNSQQQYNMNNYYESRCNNDYVVVSPQYKQPQQSYLQHSMMYRYGLI